MDLKDRKYMKEFGLRVRNRRKELKMTQEDVSKRVNYTIQAISMIENGKRNCNQTEIAKLAVALDCSAGYLMGWEEIEESQETTPAEIAADVIYNYLVKSGFVKPGEDLSDEDFRFLQSQLEAISAWFRSKKDLRK